MDYPLVSVIIPVYKAEQYLQTCLNSVLSQTYSNLEVICVNDGSPDKCLDILMEYKNKDKRLTVINNPNQGVSASRNDALIHAHGEYIVFVDADDWLDSEAIESAYIELQKNKLDVVLWTYTSEHENTSVKKDVFSQSRQFDEEEVKSLLHRRLFGLVGSELAHPELADSLCTVWGKLYKTKLIGDIRFTDLKEIGTYEDGLFNIEAFGRIKNAAYLDRPMYHYRRNNVSAQTAKYRPLLYDQWQNLYTLLYEYIQEHHLGEIYKEALYNRIALGVLGLGMDTESADNTTEWKIDRLNTIISNSWYEEALKRLKLNYFPIHWKLFYYLAKHKQVRLLRMMIVIIRKVVYR